MSQKQVKAVSSSIVVVGIVALGYYVMKALGKKTEEEAAVPDIIKTMQDKAQYFSDKGEEFKEIAEDHANRIITNKEIMDAGIMDVATKINTAVGTINELRTMMGREPSTLVAYDLNALQSRLNDALKTTVVEPVKAIYEPIRTFSTRRIR